MRRVDDRPGPAALDAWRTFLQAHAVLTRRLGASLEAEQGLGLGEYDVLLQLREAPEHALRMSELAERVLLSRSGLSRLVDRMARDGLVDRQRCPGDARGTLAVLTPAGRARLRRAATTHLPGVADVTARLEPGELEQLAGLLRRLADAGASPGGCEPDG